MQWGGVESSLLHFTNKLLFLGAFKVENTPIAQHKIEQFISSINIIEELAKDKPNVSKLKSYKGFGGLKRCFWDKSLYGQLMGAIRKNFGKEREKEILESLRNSSNSAYYTPKEVVSFIYRYLQQVCKFTGGSILEPSCGSGVFFEHMPENIKQNSIITGIEYDTVTSKLVKSIYPEIEIINAGLQNIDFEGKKYDLIIGNPPYGKEKITDKFMSDLDGYTIHHYFVAKCMRLLKDDGVMALVVPSFYMDIPKAHTRHIIDNESVLIDAVRLPDNLFEQANVSVDIIFIRKSGNKFHNILYAPKFTQGNASDYVNKFWLDNPNRIIGKLKLKWVEAYKRYVPSCQAQSKEQALQQLNICEFTQSTIENYQKIVGNYTSENNVLLEASSLLYKHFLEIEQLKMDALNIHSSIDNLLNSTWNLVEKINKIIDY